MFIFFALDLSQTRTNPDAWKVNKQSKRFAMVLSGQVPGILESKARDASRLSRRCRDCAPIESRTTPAVSSSGSNRALDKKSPVDVQRPPRRFGPATYYWFQLLLI